MSPHTDRPTEETEIIYQLEIPLETEITRAYDRIVYRYRKYNSSGNSEDVELRFQCVFLLFGESKSKYLKKAMKIYKSIPERYRLEIPIHSVRLYHLSDYLTIRRKFQRLAKIVDRWKSSEFYMNDENGELKLFDSAISLCALLDKFTYIVKYDEDLKNNLPEINEE